MNALKSVRAAVFDTMILIYLLENDPAYATVCEALFQRAEVGRLHGLITPITMGEVLVKPLRAGLNELADRYRSALRNLPNVRLCDFTWKTGALAGALRAKYGLALPDLFQVACAIENQAALITNDKALKKIIEVPVFLLSDIQRAHS